MTEVPYRVLQSFQTRLLLLPISVYSMTNHFTPAAHTCTGNEGFSEPPLGTSLYFFLLVYFPVQTNTYQGLVVTDGVQSYTIFTYNCQLMEWSGHAGIGINAGGIFHRNHNFSTADDAIEVACLYSPESNWSNVMYQLRKFQSNGWPHPWPHLYIQDGHTPVFRMTTPVFRMATPLYSGWPHLYIQDGHTPVFRMATPLYSGWPHLYIQDGHTPAFRMATPLHSGWPHPCIQDGHTPAFRMATPLHSGWPHPCIQDGHTPAFRMATPLHSGWPHPCIQDGHTPVFHTPVFRMATPLYSG